jgi:hypothetical protein
MAQSTAEAKGEPTANAAKSHKAAKAEAPQRNGTAERKAVSLQERLDRKLEAARKYRSVVRFFRSHRSLLSAAEHRATARIALLRATRRLARVSRNIAAIRSVLARREARRRAIFSPKVAICDVFGPRYCGQALSVAWCESRHRTTAQNGQYLGLFQMGSYARQLFGHGSTARKQAIAAHRYFVDSGRDWSPWSCKPGYAW